MKHQWIFIFSVLEKRATITGATIVKNTPMTAIKYVDNTNASRTKLAERTFPYTLAKRENHVQSSCTE